MNQGPASYDAIGQDYAGQRRPDPRIASYIRAALGQSRSVVNIGAGTGSYEPDDRLCVAVEPSRVMLRQRQPAAAPAVMGAAERLPLADASVDAATAILTVHHWTDRAAGLAEMLRVARRVAIVLTWDQDIWRSFWLLDEYFPDCDIDARRAVPINEIVTALAAERVITVPIPHDCIDGFHGAYWRKPAAYLDPRVRSGISTYSEMPAAALDGGLRRLAADIRSGAWLERHRHLVDLREIDLGYRLIVSDLSAGS